LFTFLIFAFYDLILSPRKLTKDVSTKETNTMVSILIFLQTDHFSSGKTKRKNNFMEKKLKIASKQTNQLTSCERD